MYPCGVVIIHILSCTVPRFLSRTVRRFFSKHKFLVISLCQTVRPWEILCAGRFLRIQAVQVKMLLPVSKEAEHNKDHPEYHTHQERIPDSTCRNPVQGKHYRKYCPAQQCPQPHITAVIEISEKLFHSFVSPFVSAVTIYPSPTFVVINSVSPAFSSFFLSRAILTVSVFSSI